MEVFVNRYRRFENAQSNGYDFLISNSNVWDRRIKQWINLFISEKSTRSVSFLTALDNDFDNKFISFGTINPDLQGRYDRNGRLNYWVDLAMIDHLPDPPFAIDAQISSDYVSSFLNKVESNEISVYDDPSNQIVRKLASPTLLKLHNNTDFAEKYLDIIAEYYLFKDKKLVIILDDGNYDQDSVTVCNAIFENSPTFKKVFYISYTNDIARLFNNSPFNLFCCPASERGNIPQDDSLLIIDLVNGYLPQTTGRGLIVNILKCGLMSDFNLFIREHNSDPVINKLYRAYTPNSITALVYLYINNRGLVKFRPHNNENAILEYLSKIKGES